MLGACPKTWAVPSFFEAYDSDIRGDILSGCREAPQALRAGKTAPITQTRLTRRGLRTPKARELAPVNNATEAAVHTEDPRC